MRYGGRGPDPELKDTVESRRNVPVSYREPLWPGAVKPIHTDALVDVETGITASTTQTQGQGQLTARLSVVSTVANVDDTVTAYAAKAGRHMMISNQGSNRLQIFPRSGDDLGGGTDIAVTLAAGSNGWWVAQDADTWLQMI